MKIFHKEIRKQKLPALIFLCLALVLTAGILSEDIFVQAFDVYEMTEDNDLILEFTQKKASGSATYRYGTDNWWLSSKKMNGGRADLTSSAYNQSTVTKVNAYPITPIPTPDANGNYDERRKMRAEEIVAWASEAYGRDRILTGDNGTPGVVTAYASRTFRVYKNNVDVGKTYYCYNDISNALNEWGEKWSKGADSAFRRSYDKEIYLKFALTDLTVKVIDKGTGEEIKGYAYNTEPYIFGETVTKDAPDDVPGYRYDGYRLVGSNGRPYTGSSTNFSRVLKSSELGSGSMTLYFIYEKVDSGPDNTDPNPTSGPLPTGVTPTPTNTPTPTITPTITPTPVPQKYRKKDEADKRYFTTGQGYTLDAIAKNTSYYLANNASKTGAGRITAHEATTRAKSYLVGTDANNNTWYFIADGTKATYVHPATYGSGTTKYNADTAEVKYITELTFPETITCNGTTYTVTSIGGGSSTYHTVTSRTTSTSTSETSYDYGIITGLSYYSYESSNGTYQDYYDVEYIYGVLGNGYIESLGEKAANTDSGYHYKYENSYYVYNTTLKEITIPSTVTTICQYAFFQCEELRIINGGEGLVTIEANAFRAATHKTPVISEVWSWSTSDTESTGGLYYYYNGAYSTSSITSDMRAWETEVMFRYYMALPELPVLKTIKGNAFAYHTNLSVVVLSETTDSIGSGAFLGCNLDSITIPCKTASVADSKDTLGTKGNVTNKTIIYTEPDAAGAVAYGRKYDKYYTLKCGYKIHYLPNGAPFSPQMSIAGLENLYLDIVDGGIIYSYQWEGSITAYYYIESDGSFWLEYSKKFEKMPDAPAPEEILYNDNFSLVYYDAQGNMWRLLVSGSGNTRNLDVEEIVTAHPVSSIKSISCSSSGQFSVDYLSDDNCTYRYNRAYDGTVTHTLLRQVPADKGLVTSFYYGTTPAGQDSSKKAYYFNGYDWSTVPNARYPSGVVIKAAWSNVYSEELYDEEYDSYYTEDTYYYSVVDSSGNIRTRNPNTNVWDTMTAGIGGDIVYAKPLFTGWSDGASLIQNSDGTVYFYMAALDDLGSRYFTSSSAVTNLGTYDSYIRNVTYIKMKNVPQYLFYVELEDGSLYYFTCSWYSTATYNPTTMTRLGGDNVYFKKIFMHNTGTFADYDEAQIYTEDTFSLLGLSTDGRLFAAGYSDNFSLGTGNVSHTSPKTMTDVSNGRTYTDFMTSTSYQEYYDSDWNPTSYVTEWRYTTALGTDGNVYLAGRADTWHTTFTLTGETRAEVIKLINEARALTKWGYYLPHNAMDKYFTDTAEYIYDAGYQFSAKVLHNTFFVPYPGYDFETWNTATDGTGTDYAPETKVVLTNDLTLHAQWEASLPTIHYNANGGQGGMADTVLPLGTTSAYLAKNRFYRPDYKFTGWNTKADGTGTSYTDEAYVTGVTGYLELYAQWKEVVYTLVYMKYPYGSAGNSVWKTKTMGNGASNTTSETIEGQPMTPSGYTVTYNTNRSGTMSTTPVMGALTSANTTTSAPTFEKWQLREPDADGVHQYYGVNYAPGTVVSRLTDTDGAVLYLYPTWGGSGSYVILPNATCDGYALLGWCEAPDGSLEIYLPNDDTSSEVSTYVPVKNVTLYAIWDPEGEQGRLDFCITDTTDPIGKGMLREGVQALILKTGHKFFYSFSMQEDQQVLPTEIRITPVYRWISYDEGERRECSVYYHSLVNGKRVHFLMAGDEQDTRNGMESGCILLKQFRSVDGKRVWEGEFSLPTEVFPVCSEMQTWFEEHRKKEPMTGNENFFLKNGYLAIEFQVEYKTEFGEWISYENWKQAKVYQDAMEAGWNCMPGEVIRYNLGKKSTEDYEIGGVE
ncbi:MAG: leucine-rich repeat domain-containing protein [Lachnospiraceae bacterium]|nr:leucine-rich repeat domain-containing protein [Lachnospiraceae bacterium]